MKARVTMFQNSVVLVLTPDSTEDRDQLDKLRISANLMNAEAATWAHPGSEHGQALTFRLSEAGFGRQPQGESPFRKRKKLQKDNS